jgi:hypothetical protein
MDGIRVGDFGSCQNLGHVKVGIRGTRWANANRFVRETDMQAFAIRCRVNSDRFDAHFFASANNSQGNFATIGDKDFLEQGV